MKKKLISIVLTSVLAIGMLSGCGSKAEEAAPAEEKTEESAPAEDGEEAAEGESKDYSDITVGLSFGTLQQEHWVKSRDIMQEICDEAGATLLVQSADDDMQKQISQCENLITQGIDVLVIQALDTEAAGPIIESAHEANVPVIGFVRPIQNCDVDYFFGSDYTDCGRAQAEYALSVAPKGNYILIEGAPSDVNARVINEGHMEVLQPAIDSGDITILTEQWCENWDASEALRYIEDAFSSNNNDIDFVICANDAFAQSCLEVLTEQGLDKKILMTGNDCDLTACQRIVEGYQGETVYPCFPEIAKATINAALELAATGDCSDYTDGAINNGFKDVPFGAGEFLWSITADNMNLVYETGWHDVSEIYKNVPEEEWPDAAKEYKAAN